MFEKLMKKSGWFESKTCLNEKGKPVAQRHHEVAVRNQYKDSKPMTRCFAEPEKKKEKKEEEECDIEESKDETEEIEESEEVSEKDDKDKEEDDKDDEK
ncbi:MAG TPA: hypothetical protein VN368_02020 [Candidatus Methylomirabilis sp.]|nr:hypothetical protein [Candidatus Methylomirabilis sp.]